MSQVTPTNINLLLLYLSLSHAGLHPCCCCYSRLPPTPTSLASTSLATRQPPPATLATIHTPTNINHHLYLFFKHQVSNTLMLPYWFWFWFWFLFDRNKSYFDVLMVGLVGNQVKDWGCLWSCKLKLKWCLWINLYLTCNF